MGYGFSAINDDNAILIGDTYKSYVVQSRDIYTTVMSNDYSPAPMIEIPPSKCYMDGALYALRKVSDAANTVSVVIYGGSPGVLSLSTGYPNDFGRIYTGENGTYELVTIRSLDKVGYPVNTSNDGLELYDSSGNTTYSSNYELFRITNIFSIYLNGNSETGVWTFNYPEIAESRDIFYIIDPAVAFMKESNVVWQFNLSSLTITSTQTKIGLTRSWSNNRDYGSSAIYSVRIGHVV